MKYQLTPLPYPPSAFKGFLSAESFEYHHGKHQKAYVEKTNKLLENSKFQGASLEEIIKEATGDLFNNAAQIWNHEFFWKCMSPEKNLAIESGTFKKIFQDTFQSVEKFSDQFKDLAVKHFGSGYIWLTHSAGKLELQTLANAENPIRFGHQPILGCDLWEHAYYIDFRNERAKFIDGFISHINWSFASDCFDRAVFPKKATCVA